MLTVIVWGVVWLGIRAIDSRSSARAGSQGPKRATHEFGNSNNRLIWNGQSEPPRGPTRRVWHRVRFNRSAKEVCVRV